MSRSPLVTSTAVPPDVHAHSAGPQLVDRPSPATELSELLGDVARQALRWTGASGAAIALENDGVFVCQASAGETAPPLGTTLDRENGLSGLCVRTGSVLVCDDAEADPRVSKDACRSLAIRSIVTVPVFSGTNIGLLEVFSREPRAFDDRAVAFLGNLAEVVASIVHPEERVAVPEASAPELPESPEFELTEATHLPTYAFAASAVVLLGVLIPVAISIREDLRVPPPPRAAVVGVPKGSEVPLDSRAYASGAPAGPTADLRSVARTQSRTVQSQAAQPGNADQQYRLATAFAEGRGVKQDLVEAYAWFVVAGMSGNKDSDAAIKALTARMPESSIAQVRFRLGEMFENGYGVPKDFVSAYFWYALSEVAGHPRAASEKARLARIMDPSQVLEATRRASTWLAQHSAAPTGQRG